MGPIELAPLCTHAERHGLTFPFSSSGDCQVFGRLPGSGAGWNGQAQHCGAFAGVLGCRQALLSCFSCPELRPAQCACLRNSSSKDTEAAGVQVAYNQEAMREKPQRTLVLRSMQGPVEHFVDIQQWQRLHVSHTQAASHIDVFWRLSQP